MSYTSLEDLFGDVVGKAVRGQGLAAREVERRSGLSVGDVARITDGGLIPDEDRIRALADVLGLHGKRLVDSARAMGKQPGVPFTAVEKDEVAIE